MRRHAVIAVILVGAVAAGAVLAREQFDFAAIESWIERLGSWGPLTFAGLFAVGMVFFLPGSPFGLIGGALFGPVWGTAINLGGATLGATIAFLLARYVASAWVRQRIGGRLEQLVSGVEAEGWRFVALTRLVPVFPCNLLNYALGLTRIPVLDYVTATALCMLPGTAAYTWLGYAGRNALDGDASAIKYGLAALGLLAAIVLLPRLVRRFRTARGPGWMDTIDLERRRSAQTPAIIDVRGPDEFTGPLGHIPGARNIAIEALPARLSELEAIRGQEVVLVCRTDKRSARAADILRTAGFEHVTVLHGGMERWNAQKLPVEGKVEARPA